MSRYAGKIKVICDNNMCFPVDTNLEPLGCTCYDPYPRLPDDAIEHISYNDYLQRKFGVERNVQHR